MTRCKFLGMTPLKGCLINILVFLLTGLLIINAACVASSTMQNNILHISYEPSGMQLLYYILSAPIFMILALALYHSQKRYTSRSQWIALFPVITAFGYALFLEYVDSVITFPKGNVFFYHGALVLSVIFFLVNCMFLVNEIRKLHDVFLVKRDVKPKIPE